MQAGLRIEPLPDPIYWYRFGKTSRKRLNRSAEAAQLQVIAPYLEGLPAEERAFAAYATAGIGDSAERVTRGVAWLLRRVWQRMRHMRPRWSPWA